MAIGDIEFTELKIGGVDLTDPNQAMAHEVRIHQDLLNALGPACEIQAVDPTDAIGKNKINGSYDQDVIIRFKDDMGRQVGFKMKQLEGSNLSDEAQAKQGSLHAKSYTIKCVAPEFLNAQGNYVQKSWNDKTSKVVEDILKENLKTESKINIGEATKEKRRLVFGNEHPLKCLQKLNDEHVASKSPSSTYALYKNQRDGEESYEFDTYENLCAKAPVATLKQSTNLDTSSGTEDDKRNSIMWLNVSENFFSGSRYLTASTEDTFNLTTHGVVSTDPKETKFNLPGKEIYQGKPKNYKAVPQKKILSKVNEPNQRIEVGDAKRKRAEFLSHLAQNSAECEIVGNPAITPGSMVNLVVPNRVDAGMGSGRETQFADKCLVVGVTTIIKPAGQNPRYVQRLKLVKGSFVEGGGTA